MDLAGYLKGVARDLGFQRVGIARAGPIPRARAQLEGWLESGFQATLDWMARRRGERGDIQTYFPTARSVIVVGLNYFSGTSREVFGGTPFKFSNYAWGEDYHRLVSERLKVLLAALQEHRPGVQGKTCVDTAPVMEKVWARRAGLGWQGKHTNLISRDYGSWLFLGELIVDHQLEADPPFDDDLCGSCRACIEACPTGALSAYQLDARKCISYLTVEHRGELPEEYRHRLEGWIYGCDRCQEVCPWNLKFQQLSPEKGFQPRWEIRDWGQADWLNLDQGQFRKIFRHSAVQRTKFSGLKRNLAANRHRAQKKPSAALSSGS